MVNGLPGRMGLGLAKAVINRWGVDALLPYSLTGEQHLGDPAVCMGNAVEVELVAPSAREEAWHEIGSYAEDCGKRVIAIDFTHPDAALPNVQFYASKGIPFVMGTTGGDMQKMEKLVQDHDSLYAVIAPNMGKPIVMFQAMIAAAAATYPGALKGYRLDVVESHQSGKADTSGTAKAVVESMHGLGLEGASTETIQMIRDPASQRAEMGVPEEHLGAHAFHTYRIASPDNSVELVLEHNVCGGAVYHEGTLDAVAFLIHQMDAENPKRLWSMVDILSHGVMS